MRLLLAGTVLLFASRGANAACVISGARPTVPLPTMEIGQEFSFLATRDCATLRFTIRGTTASKIPRSVGPMGPGPRTYRVVLADSEWDAVVAESGSTITWVVTGTTSAGVMTRMVTTNDLQRDVTIFVDLATAADATFVGEEIDYHAGYGVSGAGDVDADGHADLLIGTWPRDDAADEDAAAAYLVRGPVTGSLDLSLADAILVDDEDDGTDRAGYSVSDAGDVDGDGHDDLLVGAQLDMEGGGYGAGGAYLVQGPVTGTVALSAADAKLVGEEAYDYAGYCVSDAGDVDRDGHGDLLIGAPWYDYGGTENVGVAYLVLGPVTGTIDLSLADAKFLGDTSEESADAGTSVSGAGDLDGDGGDDVLVAMPGGGYPNYGAILLFSGPVTGTLDSSLADATLWTEGGDSTHGTGWSLSNADVDADGHDDLLISAPQDFFSGVSSAYLVSGPVTGTKSLADADAKFVGHRSDDIAGSVSGAGDVDSDGFDDVLVGADGSRQGRSGAAFLVRGPVMGTVELSHPNAPLHPGVPVRAATSGASFPDAVLAGDGFSEDAGWSVSGVGDVDGDGQDDLLVGAPDLIWGGAGAAYLVYGGSLF